MEEVNRAGFFSRFLAWLIDIAAVAILSFVLSLLFSGFITVQQQTSSGFLGFLTGTVSLLLVLINLILEFLYFGFLWSRSGQSFGMIALNIRVTRQDGVTLPSFMRGGLRGTVGYWISGLILGLGYIWALIDSQQEAWHDKMFDTWVIIPSPFEVKK